MATLSSRLLHRIARPATMWAAWSRVAAGSPIPGADGVSVADFTHDLDRRLGRLSALLTDGSYQAQPLRSMTIVRGGQQRERGLPTVCDRVVQRAFLHIVGDRWGARRAEVSFAYQRGRSWVDALTRAQVYRDAGLRHVVRADIADFFASIDHAVLTDALHAYLRDPAVVALATGWASAPILTPNGLRPRPRGIPEGAPISPALANLYLKDFDAAIDGGCGRLVRFADDLALFCPDQRSAIDGARRIGAALAELGLRMHPDKTEITTFDAGFTMLGWVFDGDHGRPAHTNPQWTHPLTVAGSGTRP